MRISIINNVWSRVDVSNIDKLRSFLSYEKSYWRKTIKGKRIFFYTQYLVSKSGVFFTGFIPMILEKYNAEIVDNRNRNATFKRFRKYRIKDLNGVELREYQLKLIRTGIYETRGVLKAPTGSGKTLIIAGLIYSIKNCNCLIIVHTKTLLKQISLKLEELLNEKIGNVGEGKKDIKRITVGMIQSLSRLSSDLVYELSCKTDMLIVDEVHHAQSNSYIDFLKLIDAPFRYGLSATPKEIEDGGDYLKVVGILGKILEDVSYEDIQEVMPVPYFRIIKYEQEQFPSMEWKDAYLHGIVRSESRNKKIAEITNEYTQHNISVLILVKFIEHGYKLKELISNSYFVRGKDNSEDREKIKNLLQEKIIKVIIATAVFGEGVDIPDLDVVINAGGGVSKILTLQRAGRVLRKTDKKFIGTIIDFLDTSDKYLYRHSKKRKKIYKDYGFIELNLLD